MSTSTLIAVSPHLASIGVLNPFYWSTGTYFIAIAAVLLLHRLVPRDGQWYMRLGREILLIAPAVFVYFAVRGLMDAAQREAEAIRNAGMIIDLQRWLGIFHEPALQEWILDRDFLVTLFNWIYIWGHWPVVVGTLVWLIVCQPNTYRVYRNAFLLSGIAAMFVFALFPVAPPRLMPDLAVVDTVTQQSQSYRVLQPPALTNPFAAMPSLHLGWNLLMGIAIVRESRIRTVKAVGYMIPVAMFMAIILTANHYVLDGIAGGALVLASLAFLAVLRQYGPVITAAAHGMVENADVSSTPWARMAGSYVTIASGTRRVPRPDQHTRRVNSCPVEQPIATEKE